MPSIHLIIKSEALTGPYRSMDARLGSGIDVSGVVESLLSVRIMMLHVFVPSDVLPDYLSSGHFQIFLIRDGVH